MDRGTYQSNSPWGLKESDMTEQLSTHTIYHHKFPCFYIDEGMCSNVLFVKTTLKMCMCIGRQIHKNYM